LSSGYPDEVGCPAARPPGLGLAAAALQHKGTCAAACCILVCLRFP